MRNQPAAPFWPGAPFKQQWVQLSYRYRHQSEPSKFVTALHSHHDRRSENHSNAFSTSSWHGRFTCGKRAEDIKTSTRSTAVSRSNHDAWSTRARQRHELVTRELKNKAPAAILIALMPQKAPSMIIRPSRRTMRVPISTIENANHVVEKQIKTGLL